MPHRLKKKLGVILPYVRKYHKHANGEMQRPPRVPEIRTESWMGLAPAIIYYP